MPGGCLFLLPNSLPLNLASVLLRALAGTSSSSRSVCACVALGLPELSERKEGTIPETFCVNLDSDEDFPCTKAIRGLHMQVKLFYSSHTHMAQHEYSTLWNCPNYRPL